MIKHAWTIAALLLAIAMPVIAHTSDSRDPVDGSLNLYSRASKYYYTLRAPDQMTAYRTWTLPSDYGTANYFLKTNGAGVLSWAAAAGGVSIGDTVTSATAGSVLFSGTAGVLAQDNAQLFWDDTNNRLGIGTSAPAHALQVGTLVSTQTATPDKISLGATYSDTAGSNLKFRLYDDGVSEFGFGVSGGLLDIRAAGGSGIALYTNGANERARITPSGNVGIGTSAPTQALQVGSLAANSSATPSAISLGGSYSDTAGENLKLRLFDIGGANLFGLGVSGGLLDIRAGSSSGIAFYTNNANERMRIDPSGFVGIGSSTPSEALDVVGSAKITDSGGNGGNVPHQRIRRSSTTNSSATCSVTCSAGETATGGGCQNSVGLNLTNSYPSADATWSCEYTLATGDCTAWAVCFDY